jgi:hypothetical protein
MDAAVVVEDTAMLCKSNAFHFAANHFTFLPLHTVFDRFIFAAHIVELWSC